MLGTGPFAAPLFRALYTSRHEVVALVTQPRRPARPGAPVSMSLLRQTADEHGTPILDPESINTDDVRRTLGELDADLFIVADYGQILSAETLATARLGGINLHGSLLPKYRGAAPINWAVYHGDAETGVTVIHMTPRIDAGPILATATTAIDPEETAVDLEHRLAELGAPLAVKAIDDLAAGRAAALVQDTSLATSARRLRKTDGAIVWTRPAAAIKNQIRALEPWPRTYTFWHRPGHPPLRLILGRTSVVAAPSNIPAGEVVRAHDELVVATGNGGLKLHQIQPAGKRMMTVDEFLRGHSVEVGERFGEGDV
ncbi:MAG TPA: methionyl-tRNA formyltransferase [Pirellulales bacterium]|nr:methionyl-tRNA formyltransferase [Pirellulales bacterium]